jgi:hypothetical protein
MPYKCFCCQLGRKWGGDGPKVKKKGGAIMFDFKIGKSKSQILQNRGPKMQLK